jgi:hypothetical protein
MAERRMKTWLERVAEPRCQDCPHRGEESEVRVIAETPFTEQPAAATPDAGVTVAPDELVRLPSCPHPGRPRTAWGEIDE